MFARLTITQMKTDKVNDAIRLYQESVVAAVKTQKGFRGTSLLSNFETGKGIAISIWDSEEDAIANEKSGYYQEQVAKFKDFFTAPPVREGYEVTVLERTDT
jgi:heme-degrading monooxygenase HmoA